jgi:hypothetical protein
MHGNVEALREYGEAVQVEIVELAVGSQELRATDSATSDHDGHAWQDATGTGHAVARCTLRSALRQQ